jgi:hypothetical protein
MNNKEYKIEVLATPHYHDSPNKPYFWCILSCTENGSWWMEMGDWSDTIENAFEEAYKFFVKFKTQ